MLTGLALLSVLGFAILLASAATTVLDGVERRRLRRLAAQVRVTDAVHRVLGAIVAPTVTRAGNHWVVSMRLGPRERIAAGRLAEIALEALEREGAGVKVVLAPRGEAGRA
jgi:hypothetical protein